MSRIHHSDPAPRSATGTQGERMRIEAEMPLPIGYAHLVTKSWDQPIDRRGAATDHHVELALLPRSERARACFPERWGPHRFEPVGEVFFFPAQQLVHARSDCRHQQSVVCRFSPAAVCEWLDGELKWTDQRLCGSLDIVNGNVRNLLFRIGEELRAPGFAGKTLVELMAAQLVVELFRHFMGIGERRAVGGLSGWRLRRIDERLRADGAPPTLTELAGLCHLSVRHLTRAFRASRGRSIGSCIAEARIERAKHLLASGMPVKAVAYSAGFTAASNFAAAFARATGETPRQYGQRAAAGIAGRQPRKMH
ncbi:MAG: helix-turn-helix domain-containing protein [Gammaproteobacteria bacterium]